MTASSDNTKSPSMERPWPRYREGLRKTIKYVDEEGDLEEFRLNASNAATHHEAMRRLYNSNKERKDRLQQYFDDGNSGDQSSGEESEYEDESDHEEESDREEKSDHEETPAPVQPAQQSSENEEAPGSLLAQRIEQLLDEYKSSEDEELSDARYDSGEDEELWGSRPSTPAKQLSGTSTEATAAKEAPKPKRKYTKKNPATTPKPKRQYTKRKPATSPKPKRQYKKKQPKPPTADEPRGGAGLLARLAASAADRERNASASANASAITPSSPVLTSNPKPSQQTSHDEVNEPTADAPGDLDLNDAELQAEFEAFDDDFEAVCEKARLEEEKQAAKKARAEKAKLTADQRAAQKEQKAADKRQKEARAEAVANMTQEERDEETVKQAKAKTDQRNKLALERKRKQQAARNNDNDETFMTDKEKKAARLRRNDESWYAKNPRKRPEEDDMCSKAVAKLQEILSDPATQAYIDKVKCVVQDQGTTVVEGSFLPKNYRKYGEWMSGPDYDVLAKHLDLETEIVPKQLYKALGMHNLTGKSLYSLISDVQSQPGCKIKVDGEPTDQDKRNVLLRAHQLLVHCDWDNFVMHDKFGFGVSFTQESTLFLMVFAKLIYKISKAQETKRTTPPKAYSPPVPAADSPEANTPTRRRGPIVASQSSGSQSTQFTSPASSTSSPMSSLGTPAVLFSPNQNYGPAAFGQTVPAWNQSVPHPVALSQSPSKRTVITIEDSDNEESTMATCSPSKRARLTSSAPSPIGFSMSGGTSHMNTPQPMQNGNTPQPMHNGYTPQPMQNGHIPQPMQNGNTPQPMHSGYTPQPMQNGHIPQPMSNGNTPQPMHNGYTPQPMQNGHILQPMQTGYMMPTTMSPQNFLSPPAAQGNLRPSALPVQPNGFAHNDPAQSLAMKLKLERDRLYQRQLMEEAKFRIQQINRPEAAKVQVARGLASQATGPICREMYGYQIQGLNHALSLYRIRHTTQVMHERLALQRGQELEHSQHIYADPNERFRVGQELRTLKQQCEKKLQELTAEDAETEQRRLFCVAKYKAASEKILKILQMQHEAARAGNA